jgi:hypothetical protein
VLEQQLLGLEALDLRLDEATGQVAHLGLQRLDLGRELVALAARGVALGQERIALRAILSALRLQGLDLERQGVLRVERLLVQLQQVGAAAFALAHRAHRRVLDDHAVRRDDRPVARVHAARAVDDDRFARRRISGRRLGHRGLAGSQGEQQGAGGEVLHGVCSEHRLGGHLVDGLRASEGYSSSSKVVSPQEQVHSMARTTPSTSTRRARLACVDGAAGRVAAGKGPVASTILSCLRMRDSMFSAGLRWCARSAG